MLVVSDLTLLNPSYLNRTEFEAKSDCATTACWSSDSPRSATSSPVSHGFLKLSWMSSLRWIDGCPCWQLLAICTAEYLPDRRHIDPHSLEARDFEAGWPVNVLCGMCQYQTVLNPVAK